MQGTAADLIKLAMIAVQRWLDEQRLSTRLVLQVHDELVLEVPDAELAGIRSELPRLMTQVADLTHASRQQHIDGPRGLAIPDGAGFPLLPRWSHLYPHGATYEKFLPAEERLHGRAAVLAISGYVIFPDAGALCRL